MTEDNQLTKVDFLEYMDKFKTGVYTKLNKTDKELGELGIRVGHQGKHIDAIEKKSDKWDRLNSIGIFFGALITGIIASLKSK